MESINVNMSLGSMLTHPTNETFMVKYSKVHYHRYLCFCFLWLSGSSFSHITVILCVGFSQTCGPLWAQKCGSHYFYPGVCAEVSSHFSPLQVFSPAQLSKISFMRYSWLLELFKAEWQLGVFVYCPVFTCVCHCSYFIVH